MSTVQSKDLNDCSEWAPPVSRRGRWAEHVKTNPTTASNPATSFLSLVLKFDPIEDLRVRCNPYRSTIRLDLMGSSAKKKKEKKKDFQKPKLKVGKARPQASNHTNTSFKAKAIILEQQSLSTEAPTFNAQVLHHVSLLSSRSDSQRKESLAYLATTLGSNQYASSPPLPVDSLLEKAMPLILDSSLGVRSQLDRLLRALPQQDIKDHVSKMLPYVRAAMTHLSQDIRRSAIDLLSWLLDSAGNELVSCSGGWIKTLECCSLLLNWKSLTPGESWSSSKTSFRTNSQAIARVLQIVGQLLSVGLLGSNDLEKHSAGKSSVLCHFEQHRVSVKSNAYAYLHLFGRPSDDDGQTLEDMEERQLVFNDRFRETFTIGIDGARKEGGETGRIAGQLFRTLDLTSTHV